MSEQAPSHQRVCPYCKEAIHPEAIRCKHCQADLTRGGPQPLGGERRLPGVPEAVRRIRSGRRLFLRTPGRPSSGRGDSGGEDGVERDRGVDPSGCLEVTHAFGQMYCLEYVYWEIDTDETWCSYTECAQA